MKGWYSNAHYPPPVEATEASMWLTYNPMPPTALRGRYYTDEYGFVTFTTIFPGKVVPPTIQEAPHINFIVSINSEAR
jgi:protocatechuate 3,4-dioxygenase beta subunit